jgi:hypothetical protein
MRRPPHFDTSSNDFRNGAMQKLAVVLALSALATPAQAQPRPMTPGLACGQVQQLVQRNGAIVLGTGTYTYDRYVRDLSFCQLDESLRSAWVPARDTPQCFAGYVCREGRDWFDD